MAEEYVDGMLIYKSLMTDIMQNMDPIDELEIRYGAI